MVLDWSAKGSELIDSLYTEGRTTAPPLSRIIRRCPRESIGGREGSVMLIGNGIIVSRGIALFDSHFGRKGRAETQQGTRKGGGGNGTAYQGRR